MEKGKAIVIAILTGVTSRMGILALPMVALVALNLVDYGTGMYAAYCRGEQVRSDRGFRGIAKKICMWLLVGVAVIMDWLCVYAADTIGFNWPLPYLVACLTAVWLICNEIISLLENMEDIGVEIPAFLLPLAKLIRGKAEEVAGTEETQTK